jgi:hypothetical protein
VKREARNESRLLEHGSSTLLADLNDTLITKVVRGRTRSRLWWAGAEPSAEAAEAPKFLFDFRNLAWACVGPQLDSGLDSGPALCASTNRQESRCGRGGLSGAASGGPGSPWLSGRGHGHARFRPRPTRSHVECRSFPRRLPPRPGRTPPFRPHRDAWHRRSVATWRNCARQRHGPAARATRATCSATPRAAVAGPTQWS